MHWIQSICELLYDTLKLSFPSQSAGTLLRSSLDHFFGIEDT